MLYAVERSAVIGEVAEKMPKAAARIMAGFEDAVAEIARTGEAPDPEALVAKWHETLEPEYVGWALAAALARGYEPAEFMDKHFKQLAAVGGDLAMYEEGLRLSRDLERKAGELARRLEGLWEEARLELLPAPGESAALRMLHEVAAARLAERAEVIMEEAAAIRNEALRASQLASRYGLAEHARALQAIADGARRLVDEVFKLRGGGR